MRVKRGSYTEQLLPLMMIKIIKVTSIIFLILVIFALYNSIYFDIPRSDVVSKHAKGNSEFIELDDGNLICLKQSLHHLILHLVWCRFSLNFLLFDY